MTYLGRTCAVATVSYARRSSACLPRFPARARFAATRKAETLCRFGVKVARPRRGTHTRTPPWRDDRAAESRTHTLALGRRRRSFRCARRRPHKSPRSQRAGAGGLLSDQSERCGIRRVRRGASAEVRGARPRCRHAHILNLCVCARQKAHIRTTTLEASRFVDVSIREKHNDAP